VEYAYLTERRIQAKKVKLSLGFNEHHIIKEYCGSGVIAPLIL
jgi:hypothetical protein